MPIPPERKKANNAISTDNFMSLLLAEKKLFILYFT
jgi:hypothetical protein